MCMTLNHTEIIDHVYNRNDFTMEFPRPLMPNVILVGGINCNVRNPLPEVRLCF